MATKTTKKKSVTKKSAAKKGTRKPKSEEITHELYTIRMPIALREALNERAAKLTEDRGSKVTAATVLREILARSLNVSIAG